MLPHPSPRHLSDVGREARGIHALPGPGCALWSHHSDKLKFTTSDVIKNDQDRFTCFGNFWHIHYTMTQLGSTYGKIGHPHAEIVDITPGSVAVEFLVHPSMRGGDRRTATNL